MRRLAGVIRPYAWGSRHTLAALQGRPVPSAEPEAELWLGAHPAAPSLVDGVPLPQLLTADPAQLLGEDVVARFGPRLPYLLKLLAAQAPLSLQAHPDSEQARAGYAAESARPPNGERTYVDPYHKPEVLVAVDEFEALCGFRAPMATADILSTFEVPELARVTAVLRTPYPGAALRAAVELVMHWPAEHRAALVADVAAAGRLRARPDAPWFELAARLGQRYPSDVGVVLALLLNHVRLRPDEAVFMPAGNLHSYLSGFGVELMAASDNVVRGGLTPKRVDVPELLRLLRYEVLADPVLPAVELGPGLLGWPTGAAEFALVKAEVLDGAALRLPGTGPRILVCVAGPAACHAGAAPAAAAQTLAAGEAVFVGANEPSVSLSARAGPAVVFQAAVPA